MTALDEASLSEPPLVTATRLGAETDQRWTELDVGCRLPSDLYEAALVARLFRTLVPAEMGGTGGSPVAWFEIGVELARHDPSLGWVVTQGAAELGWIAAGGDPDWATEVLTDPLGASASSIAGVGELKLNGSNSTLSGRWSFNTGCPSRVRSRPHSSAQPVGPLMRRRGSSLRRRLLPCSFRSPRTLPCNAH